MLSAFYESVGRVHALRAGPAGTLLEGFAGKLLDKLGTAVCREPLSSRWPAAKLLVRKAACHRKWVVYCKAPLAGPEQVLRYLGRYTHRIAIGNERLLELRDGQVSFRYHDRARRRRGVLRLPAAEFVRRFLLHVLPRGLVRVRHYGLLANGVKRQRLDLCRRLLGAPCDPKPMPAEKSSWADTYERLVGRNPLLCPYCRVGHVAFVAAIPPAASRASAVHAAPRAPPAP